MQLAARAKEADIDFIVCAGDLSNFGRGLKFALKELEKTGKKIYVIPGNHEEVLELGELEKVFPFCVNFHRQAFKKNDYVFLGYGGGGFAMEDEEFRKVAREWYGKYQGKKIVLVFHGPPFGTKVDLLQAHHVGNKDYLKFIQRIKPKLVICGHLHELAGQSDLIGKSKVINPGWDGKVVELK